MSHRITDEQLHAFLMNPDSYPHRTRQVSVVETHISWVFLTDDHAYKLKKPVTFPFLDFSTLEKRHDDCVRELHLNRRLAPSVYLDVVPVVADEQSRLSLQGDGKPVDWLVWMNRLPAECALDRRVARGDLESQDIMPVADLLIDFYRRLPPADISAERYCRWIEKHIRGNLAELSGAEHRLEGHEVRQIHETQLIFLDLFQHLFEQRVREGHVVEGHGDLRPEHIYLSEPVNIIDCIEFSAEFRTLDIFDELAFLAMECEKLGAAWIGEQIFERYIRSRGDPPRRGLIDFFKAYRACVRAKVNAIRARQVPGDAARSLGESAAQYLRIAHRACGNFGRPLLVVVRGLSGTGKSTQASALADRWGCDLLQTDLVRQQLLGAGEGTANYDSGRYAPESRQRVYDELFRRANEALGERASVILDGTFLARDLRARALDMARRHDAHVLVVNCRCPPEVAAERIRRRPTSESEARPEFVASQRAQEEPDDPTWPVCNVDTTQDVAENCLTIVRKLREAAAASRAAADG